MQCKQRPHLRGVSVEVATLDSHIAVGTLKDGAGRLHDSAKVRSAVRYGTRSATGGTVRAPTTSVARAHATGGVALRHSTHLGLVCGERRVEDRRNAIAENGAGKVL